MKIKKAFIETWGEAVERSALSSVVFSAFKSQLRMIMKKKVKKTKTKHLKNLRKKMLSVVVAVVADQEDVDWESWVWYKASGSSQKAMTMSVCLVWWMVSNQGLEAHCAPQKFGVVQWIWLAPAIHDVCHVMDTDVWVMGGGLYSLMSHQWWKMKWSWGWEWEWENLFCVNILYFIIFPLWDKCILLFNLF